MAPFKEGAIEFPSWDCCHLFKAGNRLRLHVAGSSFPYYARNPGVCAPVAEMPASSYEAVFAVAIELVKEADSAALSGVSFGQVVTYTFTVTNTGKCDPEQC